MKSKKNRKKHTFYHTCMCVYVCTFILYLFVFVVLKEFCTNEKAKGKNSNLQKQKKKNYRPNEPHFVVPTTTTRPQRRCR